MQPLRGDTLELAKKMASMADVYVSDDLIRWSEPIHVVTMDNDWTRGSKAGNNQIHANDMLYLNGQFHMFWSVNHWGDDLHAVHIVHSQSDKVLGLQFAEGIGRPDKNNIIDIYLSDECEDVLGDDVWRQYFAVRPEPFTKEEQRAYLSKITGVSLGSDAFFPFSDNIERAKKSGVSYIAQPGGSVRDDLVIEACDKYNMVMAFTGMRLFHH